MHEFARTATAIAATGSTLEKTRLLADYLRELPPEELRRASIYMTGQPYGRSERKKLSLGWVSINHAVNRLAARPPEEMARIWRRYADVGDSAAEALAGRTHPVPTALIDAQAALEDIRTAPTGADKEDGLVALLDRLEPIEAGYLLKVLTFELRIGLQEGLVEAALASAFDIPLDAVRRVHMLTGDIGETALRCREGRIEDARLTLFVPIRFMLASALDTAEDAFAKMRTSPLWTEEKYDGVRCQLHLADGRAELFSRDLKETASAFPELVEAAAAIDHELILDGEVLAARGDQVLPFFELQRRLGRKQVSAKMREQVPLVLVVFDLLHLDGLALMELPLRERRRLLEDLALRPPFLLARVEEAASVDDLERIFAETRARGNEGLMIKDPASAYTPGRRGGAWLKLKRPLATLDVVVTGVEWGHGKRRGVLSDYTFAVRDDAGTLLNVGKAYTGLTDAEIEERTRYFLEHTISDHGWGRLVEPELVIEVAFDSIQRSNRHKSGFALRFPRIVRLRPDKPVAEIDTLARVEELYGRYFARFTPLADVADLPDPEPGRRG